jgi:AraC-like DNA-binding protein
MPLSRALRSRPRLEMDLGPGGLSLGRYNQTRAREALPEHVHQQVIEICYLVKGRQNYRVHGRNYHLRGGDVFMTFPGEQHSSGGAPQEKGVLYWLALPFPRRASGLPGLSNPAGRTLWRAVRDLPVRHFPGSARMEEHLDALTLAVHENSSLREVTMSYLVTGFLLEVVARGSVPAPKKRRSLEAVLRHIAGHLDEPASVPQLAQIARLSTPHFKARFKQETGVSPAEYQLRMRIGEARRRLAGRRQTVTEVAFDLGFSSSQYFATVFKRFTGQNPGALRKTVAGSSGL